MHSLRNTKRATWDGMQQTTQFRLPSAGAEYGPRQHPRDRRKASTSSWIVEDDVHHHTKEEADQGDAVRVLFSDAKRQKVMGEYLFALVEPSIKGMELVYNKYHADGDDSQMRLSAGAYAEQICRRRATLTW